MQEDVKPCVVRLKSVIEPSELEDPVELEALEHDLNVEAARYGSLEGVTIIREAEEGEDAGSTGTGDVVLKFHDFLGAERAARALQGRLFGECVLQAELVDSTVM